MHLFHINIHIQNGNDEVSILNKKGQRISRENTTVEKDVEEITNKKHISCFSTCSAT